MNKNILTACITLTLTLAGPAFAQESFDSPDAAAQALIDSAEKHDAARLTAIFGPDGNAILTSGNPSQDRADQSEFSKLARAKHRLMPDTRNPNRMILSIGDEDWPFPVPLVRANGKWTFNASETKTEMAARVIGTHELDAIEICAGFVDAERKYAEANPDKDGSMGYASHMFATDGHDGLYSEGAGASLVPRALAEATWDGQKPATKPYHGYYFRILNGQGSHAAGGSHTYLVKNRLMGGFGLVAWPAQYGVTGIYTFMVNQDGAILEKDIPPPAAGGTLPITRYDPDPSWKLVD